MFHRHKWEIVKKICKPGMMGHTIKMVKLRCIKCGKTRYENAVKTIKEKGL